MRLPSGNAYDIRKDQTSGQAAIEGDHGSSGNAHARKANPGTTINQGLSICVPNIEDQKEKGQATIFAGRNDEIRGRIVGFSKAKTESSNG